MSPTFTIFQDPPCASDNTTCASSSKTLTIPLSSTRSFGRPTSNSTSLLALDADKENIDPKTGLPRATATKPKNKKSLGSKKDSSSKVLTKASKASRGSATSGPAKSGKLVRTSPYPDPAVPSFLTELSYVLPISVQPPTPCLITGLGASGLSDFAEPDFDLQSDFVQQPSPTRSAPITGTGSLWSSPLPSHAPETEGDRKARDLTELPLADLSEAFAADTSTGAKKSIYQNKAAASGESLLSFLSEDAPRLPSMFQTVPQFELHRPLIADFDSDVSVY